MIALGKRGTDAGGVQPQRVTPGGAWTGGHTG